MSKAFPLCQVCGTPVVEGFPSECAPAKPNPGDALLKNRTSWPGYDDLYPFNAAANVRAERELRKAGI